MKKIILLAFLALSACSAQVGTEAGNDPSESTGAPVDTPRCDGVFQDPQWYLIKISDPGYRIQGCDKLDVPTENILMCDVNWCAAPGEFSGSCPVCPK